MAFAARSAIVAVGLFMLWIVMVRGLGALLPDSGQIAFSDDRGAALDILLLDTRTRAVANLTKTRNAAEAALQWSPDGARLLYHTQMLDGSRSSGLRVMDVRSRAQRALAQGAVSGGWSPDGSRLVLAMGSAFVQIDSHTLAPAQGDIAHPQPPLWSIQGLQALIGRQPGIAIPGIDLDDQSFLFTVTHASWAAGGRWGAFRIDYWEATGLYVLDAVCLPDCLGAARLIPGTEDGHFPSVSPDGARMAYVCRGARAQPYLCLIALNSGSRQYLAPLRGAGGPSAWRPPG